MAEQVASDVGASGSAQVFVDDSGRRGRWVRRAGAGMTTLCAAYVGIVVVGLSQTAVGPLITVPSAGNGLVAGFPNTSGIVPGLLSTFGPGVARPVHREPITRLHGTTPIGIARPVRAPAAASARPTASPSFLADAGPEAKSTTTSRDVRAPAHGRGSPAESDRRRDGVVSDTAPGTV